VPTATQPNERWQASRHISRELQRARAQGELAYWKELQSSAIVVLISALLISLIVFLMDYIFGVQNMSNNGFWKGYARLHLQTHRLLGHGGRLQEVVRDPRHLR
jgi:hypothetical protein